MWLLGLLACTPELDPDALAAQLLSGDLDEVIATLSAEPAPTEGPLSQWAEVAARITAVSEELVAIRAAERDMLLVAAREFLDSPHPADAAASMRAGLQADPADPDFLAVRAAFASAAAEASPADAARMAAV
ncbi:MAG: hypothetical protein ACI8S6_004738, partial [Myxococcota bacterium]